MILAKIYTDIKDRKLDGRWFLGGSHIILVAVAFIFFNLQRSYPQVLFAFFVAITAEFVLSHLIKKDQGRHFIDRAFSAATECAGLLVLTKSPFWWTHGLLAFLAVGSKYFLRKPDGGHIFNPTNFAITSSLIVLPTHWFGTWTDEYMISAYPMIQVSLMGAIAVWLARTYVISIAYILGVIFWAMIFYPALGLSNIIYALGPEFGAIGLIFLFLMITDPKTAPKKYKDQALYAFAIAFIHILLRHQQLLYSRYISLFIVTIILYSYSCISPKKGVAQF